MKLGDNSVIIVFSSFRACTDILPNDGAGKLFDAVKTMAVVARATCVGVTLSQHSLFLGGEAKSCDESLTTKQQN